MTYLAIVKVNPLTSRVEKYQGYDTEAEAMEHVARVIDTFPEAYYVVDPGGQPGDWLCDPRAKTAVLDPLPLPPPPDPADEAERRMTDDPTWRGLVKRIAAAEGKTPRQVMDEIKSGA